MAIDGPLDITHAERGMPLVQPASQQCANIAKQWQADLGMASVNQPSPQHNLTKVEHKVDIEAPIERPPEGFARHAVRNEGLQQREPSRLNQQEAQAALRQFILDRAKRRSELLRLARKWGRHGAPSRNAGQNQPGQEDEDGAAI